MLNTREIHVVFAADDRFVMPLTVAMCSAAVNCSSGSHVVFYVLQNGIGTKLRMQVEASVMRTKRDGVRIIWLDVSINALNRFKTNGHLTAMTYARLLIPAVIPSHIEHVLYLDSDIVVLGDLAELWNIGLGGNIILASQDQIVNCVSGPLGLINYADLGIAASKKYFNAGVLSIDLKRWRSEDVSQRVCEYLDKYRDIIRMVDQEALNAVLCDAWGELAQEWNWQVGRLKWLCRKPEKPVAQKRIIHFTTASKPWLPRCRYKERRKFFEYLDTTEWAGW